MGLPGQDNHNFQLCSSSPAYGRLESGLFTPGRPWRKKGHRRLAKLAIVVAAYAVGILLINSYRVVSGNSFGESSDSPDVSQDLLQVLVREQRAVHQSEFVAVYEQKEKADSDSNCTPRSVNNFPDNFMTFEETRDGGFVVHLLIALYMFAALAVVCDDYFVPALEHICEDLGLQADVAGATFMAAGSSAPEFMTSVIGVFFAESDVGVGTIVGSAVFNILFIIGVCGLFAGMVVELTWYPLVRDTLCYLVSVLTLFIAIRDQSIQWYEALVMIFLYFGYILLMYFNRGLEKRARAAVKRLLVRVGRQPLVNKKTEEYSIPENMKRARAHSRISHSLSLSMSMSRDHVRPSASLERSLPVEQETPILEEDNQTTSRFAESSKSEDHITVSEFESVWKFPDNIFIRVLWVIMIPLKAVFYVTIPDSRRAGIWGRLYMLSFFMSVLWISGLTYIMVWMVTIAGDALDIPDTVMGLTLLAAGTSVPDCLSSVFVARDGYGDMAVSNSLGSNVFDILMCLGLPWMLESAINGGDRVPIESGGLTYSTLILLATVVFLLVSMGVNKWRLTKSYGVVCLVAYVMVVILSCLFELNIIDDINPPACPR